MTACSGYRPGRKACAPLVLAGMLLSGCGSPDSGSSESVSIPGEVKQSIKERVRVGTNVGIVVGLVDSGGRDFFADGNEVVGGSQGLGPETVFEVGSVSKVFTGTLLSLMVEEGVVQLDDPLQSLLPGEVMAPTFDEEPIRLVHLATHSAGFPRAPSNLAPTDPENPFADYTVAAAFDFLGHSALRQPPGSVYSYSNFGMGLLGDVLGALDGGDFESALIEKVTGPLGMGETFVSWEGFSGVRATGHRLGTEVSDWDFSALAGAGGIRSTASNLLTFIEANLGLRPTSMSSAFELAREPHGGTDDPLMKIGLGWHILSRGNMSIVWHNGTTGGFSSFLGFVPDRKLGVVVLTNSASGADDIGWHLLDPSIPLEEVKRPIAVELNQILKRNGTEEMVNRLERILSEERDSYAVDYPELKRLAYSFLPDGCPTAVPLFKATVRAYPEEVNALLSLAEAHFVCGQPDAALAAAEKAQALDPDDPVAKQLLDMLRGG